MSASSLDSAVVFLNVPPKTFIGINLVSFNSSPNFHGISRLSLGLHFIYTGTDASLSIRNGRWLRIQPPGADQQVFVLRWSTDLETLELLSAGNEAFEEVKRSLSALEKRGLVDYSALSTASSKLQMEQTQNINDDEIVSEARQQKLWISLASHTSDRLLDRVLSSNYQDDSYGRPTDWTISSISSAPTDTEHIPGLSSQETDPVLSSSTRLNLLPIDLKHTWPESSIGRERTEKARDRSWYLNHLLEWLSAGTNRGTEVEKQVAARELLGELQFCFLMVFTLANYSCLEQWKRILSVLFTCETALNEIEGYFCQAINVLKEQLSRVEDVEGGLFELGDEQNSAWLRKLLRTFRRNVDEVQGSKDTALQKDLSSLEAFLKDKYGWEDESNLLKKGMVQLEDGEMVEMQIVGMDEEEETGEYAPTVVE